jgi:hypothetical protein
MCAKILPEMLGHHLQERGRLHDMKGTGQWTATAKKIIDDIPNY